MWIGGQRAFIDNGWTCDCYISCRAIKGALIPYKFRSVQFDFQFALSIPSVHVWILCIVRLVHLLEIIIIMSSTWEQPRIYELEKDFFTTFQYQASRILGRGSFGEVVLAKSLTKGRSDKAVKWCSRHTETGEDADLTHFLDEVNVLYNLKHRRLVEMCAANVCPQFAYIVMEIYPKGDLLENFLDLNWYQVCRYMVDISSAVHYLHKKRIVHKDIKPNNILISANDEACLADLGMAERMSDQQKKVSEKFGNSYHRAPEMKVEPLEPFCPFKVSLWKKMNKTVHSVLLFLNTLCACFLSACVLCFQLSVDVWYQ